MDPGDKLGLPDEFWRFVLLRQRDELLEALRKLLDLCARPEIHDGTEAENCLFCKSRALLARIEVEDKE